MLIHPQCSPRLLPGTHPHSLRTPSPPFLANERPEFIEFDFGELKVAGEDVGDHLGVFADPFQP
jgi:hypothetical protein